MKIFFLFATLLLTVEAYAENLNLSKYPKVFKGEESVVVTIVPVMPESSNKALVQVSGIDNETLDGKVFLHEIKIQGQDKAMVLMVDGQERTRLRAQASYWWKEFTLYLPLKANAISLSYDEKLSKAAKPAKLLAQYNKTDMALQKNLAKFNRKASEKREEADLAEIDASVAKSCGTVIKTIIDWKTISDGILQNHSISTFCGEVSERLDSLCGDAAFKPKAKKVAKVTCYFGPELKLTRSGDMVTIMVELETRKQEDFVSAYLKNEL